MRNYLDRIKSYNRNAESNYRNANGNGSGMAMSNELDPNDRTLTVTVQNTTTATISDVVIFGATKDLTYSDKEDGAVIAVSESSRNQVNAELLTSAWRIQGLKLTTSSDSSQFSNNIKIFSGSSTGALDRRIFQPLNYRSAQNNLSLQIDLPTFELILTSQVYLMFNVIGSETLTFTFTIVEKLIGSNALMGKPMIERSLFAAPTGLAQIDLRRTM